MNEYITQLAQTQADMMKAFVGARVQLRQLIRDDNFPLYSRFMMHRYWPETRDSAEMNRPTG